MQGNEAAPGWPSLESSPVDSAHDKQTLIEGKASLNLENFIKAKTSYHDSGRWWYREHDLTAKPPIHARPGFLHRTPELQSLRRPTKFHKTTGKSKILHEGWFDNHTTVFITREKRRMLTSKPSEVKESCQ